MTPSPSSSTVPEHSKPGMNGGFRGLGYSPWRCAMSAKLRPLGDFFKKMVYLQRQLTFKTINSTFKDCWGNILGLQNNMFINEFSEVKDTLVSF